MSRREYWSDEERIEAVQEYLEGERQLSLNCKKIWIITNDFDNI